MSSHRAFHFCINTRSSPSPPSCFQAWLQWIVTTDEALVLLCTLSHQAELPYYSSISSQQSLLIQVIRQQSACLRAHWSRKIETGKGTEGGGRREEKQIKRGTRQTNASLSAPVEDSIKKEKKRIQSEEELKETQSAKRQWDKIHTQKKKSDENLKTKRRRWKDKNTNLSENE